MILNLIFSIALTGDLTPIQPQDFNQPAQQIPLPFQGETPTQKWADQMQTDNQMNQNWQRSIEINNQQREQIYRPYK